MPETTIKEKTVTTTVIDTIPTVKTLYWVAIVYRPKKESNAIEDIDSVDYNENKRPLPVFVRQIMLPPEQNGSGQGSGPSFDWIELRPGANVHILYSDWQRAEKMPLVKALIGVSVDVVATSTVEDDQPGYRHFASADAIRLVKLTTASGFIDEWMQGEVRPEVIKAANERKNYLETELAKRVS